MLSSYSLAAAKHPLPNQLDAATVKMFIQKFVYDRLRGYFNEQGFNEQQFDARLC